MNPELIVGSTVWTVGPDGKPNGNTDRIGLGTVTSFHVDTNNGRRQPEVFAYVEWHDGKQGSWPVAQLRTATGTDYGNDRDSGPYNFARITTEDGSFDAECRVSVAAALLECGSLESFDGVVKHGDAAEHLYTVSAKRMGIVANLLEQIAK